MEIGFHLTPKQQKKLKKYIKKILHADPKFFDHQTEPEKAEHTIVDNSE